MSTVEELEHQLQIADTELRQLRSDNEILRAEIDSINNRLERALQNTLDLHRTLAGEVADQPLVPVLIESPYAGNVDLNLKYVRACMRECLLNGEAPFASHALYTQSGVLDDNNPTERQIGIVAGLSWGRMAAKTIAYVDLGVSSGMQFGFEEARRRGRKIERRLLSNWKG